VPSEHFHIEVAKVDDNLGGELVDFLLGYQLRPDCVGSGQPEHQADGDDRLTAKERKPKQNQNILSQPMRFYSSQK